MEEISHSELETVQRRIIKRSAVLAQHSDSAAQDLLDELTSSHQLNAELIALVKLFKSAWQQPTFHEAAACLQGSVRVASHSYPSGKELRSTHCRTG